MKVKRSWAYGLLLLGVLLIAAYLRFSGLNWDLNQHLHPDERFLTDVVARISPVESLSAYFDTANSTLNPANNDRSFFVYGTYPLFFVRFMSQWLDRVDYNQIQLVGRALSGLSDLLVVALVFFIGRKLYDYRVALLAALFSAFTVAQIQQSHFFTVDNFLNSGMYLALFFAIRVAAHKKKTDTEEEVSAGNYVNLWDFVFFGLALGLAAASKVSAAPLALVLPFALYVRLWNEPEEVRRQLYGRAFLYLLVAAWLSLLVFRILQPYTFTGPGFFDVALNPQWLDTMRSLQAQVSGDADWPPSQQWARRGMLFGFENMTRWGMGIPLAVTAWLGLLWTGLRVLRDRLRRPEAVLWVWAAGYFVWQSMAFNPTMRYFLPVYPALAIFAAWAVFALWDAGSLGQDDGSRWRFWARPLALTLGTVALLGSLIWSFAFLQVYQNSHPRIAAARWIYQNLPGPITLNIEDGEDGYRQPIGVNSAYVVQADQPLTTTFRVKSSGQLDSIDLYHVLAPTQLTLSVADGPEAATLNRTAVVDLLGMDEGDSARLAIGLPLEALADQQNQYQLSIILPSGEGRVEISSLQLSSSTNSEQEPLELLGESRIVELGETAEFDFGVDLPGLDQVQVQFLYLEPLELDPVELSLSLSAGDDPANVLAEAEADVLPATDGGGLTELTTFELDTLIEVELDETLLMQLSVSGDDAVTLLGSAVANESSWDDGLPLRIDEYDGFGGIYQGDLNFEMYWDANPDKLNRFLGILDRAEYIFITSSRQWASLPRIPERYPLVTTYYRELLGCPEEQSIEWCYNVAGVGSFEENLGFDLVQVWDNSPRIGSWKINDQPSEEAFTVYDHPKVFIFKKSTDYDQQHAVDLLSAVDLNNVIHLTPKEADGSAPANLMLPGDRWAAQRAGGTWSQLFDMDSFVNANPWVSALVWYLALAALGLIVYPLVRVAMPGLRDKGYPFARLVGLLLLSYFAWLAGSLGLGFTRPVLLAVFGALLLVGLLLAFLNRGALREEWQQHRSIFLRTEVLFFAFFFFMLLIRLGNPDLWHPSYGGEKPMDFSYFNAVLKSSSFPAYDPWFAGGYINYYYYGFVLVGSLTKLLGIIPSVAYNLILPSLFAMLALGAYSIAWNLFSWWQESREGTDEEDGVSAGLVGLAAALAVSIFGNMGSLQMILQGYQRLGASGAFNPDAELMQRIAWTAQGFFANILGEPLPYGTGSWYWNPTRIIPAPNETVPITEFPIFTFIYADLHAHMIALPLTLLAVAWALSVVMSRAWQGGRSLWQLGLSLGLGGIIIGSLRPTNTWDLPTYLAVGFIAVAFAVWKYWDQEKADDESRTPTWLLGLGAGVLLAVLSLLAFQPYARWYRQGFNSLDLWRGSHTPSGIYLVHWGIFLFFIVSWLLWETRQWLAATPLSSLRRVNRYRLPIFGAVLILAAATAWLTNFGVAIAWLVLPLMVWVGILVFRPEQPLPKRVTLFLIGTGLFLTLMVEIVVLRGDISRMNTVFKFYLQVWLLFGLGAALSLGWLLSSMSGWTRNWQRIWRGGAVALLAAGALFILLGGSAKIRDRMAPDAPHTLDGIAYMQYAVYHDRDTALALSQDYAAIRWLQEKVEGSPVIIEAHTGEYKWGSRITINTGLPSVLGWNWHQRQQREFVEGNDIWGRVDDITNFYSTTDLAVVREIILEHGIEYIIVGQLERVYYPGLGLQKFERQEGILWDVVFEVGDTVIYRVNTIALSQN